MNRRARQRCLNEGLFKQKDKRKYHAAVNTQNVVYWCGCSDYIALEWVLGLGRNKFGEEIRRRAGWYRNHYFIHKQVVYERNINRGIRS